MTLPKGYDPNKRKNEPEPEEEPKPYTTWQTSASSGREFCSWEYLTDELKSSIKREDGFETKIGDYYYKYRNFNEGTVYRWTDTTLEKRKQTTIQDPPQNLNQQSSGNSRWSCFLCGKTETFPYVCTYCKQKFCLKHRVAETHDCIKTRYVKYIRKTWLRKYGQNITSGAYKVVCDDCGYSSNASFIESAGVERELHISEKGCDPSKVFLEEFE